MEARKKLILNIRDIALRDQFTTSERLSFFIIFTLFIILTWNPDNRSIWTTSILFAISASSIINIKIHEMVHPFIIDKLWLKLLCFNLPTILLSIIYFSTALGNSIEIIALKDSTFLSLKTPDNILSTNVAFKENWLFFLSTISLFFISTHLLLIPKSLYYVNKLICWLCISISLIALIGLIFKAFGLEKPLFSVGTSQSDFFFYFSNDSHWAAFALLWAYVSYAISTVEYENNDRAFSDTKAPLYLGLCVLLASSTLIIQASASSLFLSFAFVHLCYLCYQYYKKQKEPVLKIIRPYIFLFGSASAIKGCHTFTLIDFYDPIIDHLKKSGLSMITDSPIFGWGINSFQKLSPFYNDASLLNQNFETLPSSAINLILDFGIIGSLIICLYALILFLKYFLDKQSNSFSNTLLFALFLIVLLSFFESPFYSTPVSFSFWIIGFIAIRWSQLIYNRADEVDTREQLIISDQLRNVPFVTNPKKEVFK